DHHHRRHDHRSNPHPDLARPRRRGVRHPTGNPPSVLDTRPEPTETGRVSSTGVQEMATAPRKHLSDRQARTVAKLVDAAAEEVVAIGFANLTVRNVAKRAGVAPATAYTYFASKEHLVSEVYL